MNPRRRRLIVLASAVIAVASGGGAIASATASAGSDQPMGSLDAAVLSPRRAPELLRTLVAQTRLAGRVRALMRTLSPTSCVELRVDDSTVLAVRPDELLIPASALKLTTAAAFLASKGGTERFETRVHYPASNGASVPVLTLEGDGDPLLATPGYVETRKHPPKPFTDFSLLARRVRDAGIRRVTGGIVVIDNFFDNERRVPTWSPGYTATGDVGPLGGLAVNDGFSAYAPRLIAAPDPALAAGEQLKRELAALGVAVEGEVRRGAPPDGDEQTLVVRSAPYARVVREMLTESDNNTAELLLKHLARDEGTATRAEGVAARTAALDDLGVDEDEVRAIDGSGLDRSNRATCSVLMQTLTTRPGGYDLEDMLAVAGRTGTLNDRFTASPLAGKLRAKTGGLNGVTALVGVADAQARTKLRFAFVANGAFSNEGGKVLQDRLVAALATFPEAPPASAVAP